MAEYPQALGTLIETIAKLPGIGRRTAERLALALLDWDEEALRDFGEQLAGLHEAVMPCATCGNLADSEECGICADPHRDKTLICVVEQARQVAVIEKCARYRGLYHVLGGHLSPLEGVEPGDLNIEKLLERIEGQGVTEVILSTSPDVEGEATAAYLGELLHERFGVKVSRIALGVPMGADLSYADAATMAMAIETRRTMG